MPDTPSLSTLLVIADLQR